MRRWPRCSVTPTDLRSLTQGRGIYEMKFDRYATVPSMLAQAIIAKHKAEVRKRKSNRAIIRARKVEEQNG